MKPYLMDMDVGEAGKFHSIREESPIRNLLFMYYQAVYY